MLNNVASISMSIDYSLIDRDVIISDEDYAIHDTNFVSSPSRVNTYFQSIIMTRRFIHRYGPLIVDLT